MKALETGSRQDTHLFGHRDLCVPVPMLGSEENHAPVQPCNLTNPLVRNLLILLRRYDSHSFGSFSVSLEFRKPL